MRTQRAASAATGIDDDVVEGASRVSSNADLDRRVARWGPAVDTLLDALYGSAEAARLRERVLGEVRAAANARRSELRQLDLEREFDPAWFHDPSMIGYVAYADRFADSLGGVTAHLDYLAELRVRYFHLMKVLRSRDGANDGGFAVVDYGAVDPSLGTWADLEALADELRARRISVCIDVVMNHTAAEHDWAMQAKAGSARHREYYLTFPDRIEPDRYEATLPEVFPEIAPGNFTWDDELDAWVWTTFNEFQWDLNYANPDVLVEMLRVMLHLANTGVDVLRLDAVAFTWKRMGTDCQNQPEAHLLAQLFRALIAIAAPAVLLKAEAIVAPTQLVQYLGAHRLERPECHIAYHNQLMVMLWSSLAAGDALLARQALAALPPTPDDTTWVNYVRCHDDIGWAVNDADAAAIGISGPAHRAYLAAFYRGDFAGSYADGAAFSTNDEIGDERTCGMTAALAGLTTATTPAEVQRALARMQLLYAVVYGFAGIPLVYMGDELGLGNDESYRGDPDLAEDSRWMHRPYMAWKLAPRRNRAGTNEGVLFRWLQTLADVRSATPAMTAGGDTYIHQLPDPAVLAWARRHPVHGRFYGVANFSSRAASAPVDSLGWAGLTAPTTVLATQGCAVTASGLTLAPFGVLWLVDGADGPLQPPAGRSATAVP
jgi:amylosucrase